MGSTQQLMWPCSPQARPLWPRPASHPRLGGSVSSPLGFLVSFFYKSSATCVCFGEVPVVLWGWSDKGLGP